MSITVAGVDYAMHVPNHAKGGLVTILSRTPGESYWRRVREGVDPAEAAREFERLTAGGIALPPGEPVTEAHIAGEVSAETAAVPPVVEVEPVAAPEPAQPAAPVADKPKRKPKAAADDPQRLSGTELRRKAAEDKPKPQPKVKPAPKPLVQTALF